MSVNETESSVPPQIGNDLSVIIMYKQKKL